MITYQGYLHSSPKSNDDHASIPEFWNKAYFSQINLKDFSYILRELYFITSESVIDGPFCLSKLFSAHN